MIYLSPITFNGKHPNVPRIIIGNRDDNNSQALPIRTPVLSDAQIAELHWVDSDAHGQVITLNSEVAGDYLWEITELDTRRKTNLTCWIEIKGNDNNMLWVSDTFIAIVGQRIEQNLMIADRYPDKLQQVMDDVKELQDSALDTEDVQNIVDEYLEANPPESGIDTEQDPTVPAWAKAPQKPAYTAAEVNADPAGTATTRVAEHNVDTDSHNDIRLALEALSDRLNAFFDSDDATLDELSEIVAYITSNKSLIEAITTSKVSVSDIVNNLTTNVANKPLSAAQGVALNSMIDTLVKNRTHYTEVIAEEKTLFENETINFPFVGTPVLFYGFGLDDIAEGVKFDIVWQEDGYTQEVECTAYVRNGNLCLGNAALDIDPGEDTGEWFLFSDFSSTDCSLTKQSSTKGVVTLSMHRYEMTKVKKLDEKYLPENVPVLHTAEIGQFAAVESVDENNRPIRWKAVNAPEGGNAFIITLNADTNTVDKTNAEMYDAWLSARPAYLHVVGLDWNSLAQPLYVTQNRAVFVMNSGALVHMFTVQDNKVTIDYFETVDTTTLTEAVNDALEQAKESGEFDGEDGVDGYTPQKGVDYFDGKDGKDGQDGSPGTPGKDGADGQPGKDGTSVTVTNVSESTADGGSNVVTFSDGKTLTVNNGSKGSKGDKGDQGDPYTLTEDDKASIVAAVIESLGGNPVFGYVDENNNIIVQGNLADGTYTLQYLNTDGTYSEACTLVVGAIEEPEVIENLITTLQAPGLTGVYNGIGYKENTRQSISAGGDKTQTGVTSTGLIPWISHDDVFHFSGIEINGSTDYDFCFTCYNSSGELISTTLGQMDESCMGTDENGHDTLQLRSDLITNFVSGTAYIRLVLGAVTGTVIMTRNQLIPVE